MNWRLLTGLLMLRAETPSHNSNSSRTRGLRYTSIVSEVGALGPGISMERFRKNFLVDNQPGKLYTASSIIQVECLEFWLPCGHTPSATSPNRGSIQSLEKRDTSGLLPSTECYRRWMSSPDFLPNSHRSAVADQLFSGTCTSA